MRVSADKLLAALVKVRILEEQMVQYCTDPMQIPVPWQSVVMAVEQYTGDKIEVVRPTTGEMKLLNGAMIRWDDGLVAIVLREELTTVDENYVIVKEAMHPLIDEDVDRSPDTDRTIDLLFKSEFFGTGNGENDHEAVVHSEHLALIIACCVLVPQRIREGLKADIDSGKTTVAKAARQHGVPEHVIDIALSDMVMQFTAEATVTGTRISAR